MAKKEFKTSIRGEPWTVRYMRRTPRVDGHECHGSCSPAERVIRLWIGGDDGDRLETLVHEWFHARFPEFDEHAVELLGCELSEAIQQHSDMEEA